MLCKLFNGQGCLKSATCHYDRSSAWCPFCPYERETVTHLLFTCPEYSVIRNQAWESISNSAPPSLMEEIRGMSAEKKTTYIFSAFKGAYIDEWTNVYKDVHSH